MFKSTLLLLLLCTSLFVYSQNSYTISGIVKDQKETLPGAAVYLAGYKIATVTNNDGKFVIPNLKPGNYDILVQMIGYLPLSKSISITDKSVIVELKLTENSTLLKEVVIKPDPDREYYLNLFKDFFIGKTPNSEKCKIFNTNVLIIDSDKRNRSFRVRATDFLVIENQALGYRIKYLLENFEYSFQTRILFYAGYPTFEDLKGSKSKLKKWQKNREIAYRGSSLHFLQSLYKNSAYEEGFIINKRYYINNPNRLPDSLIDANIKRLMNGKLNSNENPQTLNEWLKKKREPKTLAAINQAKVSVDTLVKKFSDDLKMISFTDDLFVIYKNERETPVYENSSDYQIRPPNLAGHQVSVIKLLKAPIYFYSNGVTYDPMSTLYSGYWAYEKMGDSVPMDYVPLKGSQ
jgi:hypothetical protein